jgi:hypothetical protein
LFGKNVGKVESRKSRKRKRKRKRCRRRAYLAVGAGRGEAMQLRWRRLAAVAGDARRTPAALCSLSGAGRARLVRE